MRPKVLYEVDPHNRLILKRAGARSNVKRFRKVLYGRFKIDKKNSLSYEVSKSSATRTPQKIKFSGNYFLDKKHNLIYTLSKWNDQYRGNRLRMRTKIIDANANEIVFFLGKGVVKLHGAWQADKNNRLTFGVERERDKKDTLSLSNAWKINKNNEIVYTGTRNAHNILLKGSWRIRDRYRLSYILDRRISSGFDFRTSLGQIVPRGKKTYIKFDVAIDISKRKRLTRKIVFGCKFKLGKGKKIILEAAPRKRGVKLKITKELLDRKGVLYIESYLKDREKYLGGGIGFRW